MCMFYCYCEKKERETLNSFVKQEKETEIMNRNCLRVGSAEKAHSSNLKLTSFEVT